MSKVFCVALILLITGAVHADDSNWEQQQGGSVSAFDAKIEQIDLDGLKITYTPVVDGVSKITQLCTQDRAVNGNFYTEADRALAIQLRVQKFREAKKSREVIKIAVRGPWSPCIYPLEI